MKKDGKKEESADVAKSRCKVSSDMVTTMNPRLKCAQRDTTLQTVILLGDSLYSFSGNVLKLWEAYEN